MENRIQTDLTVQLRIYFRKIVSLCMALFGILSINRFRAILEITDKKKIPFAEENLKNIT